jgi:hypothetical protein
MAYFIFWILCGIIGGMIGANKGAGCTGAILGLLFGPLGIIIVIIMKGNRVKCRYCQSYIDPKAIVCPHCQKELSSVVSGKKLGFIKKATENSTAKERMEASTDDQIMMAREQMHPNIFQQDGPVPPSSQIPYDELVDSDICATCMEVVLLDADNESDFCQKWEKPTKEDYSCVEYEPVE